MARYVCVVSRDHPLLVGYMMVALAGDTSARDEIQIVLDRRREPGDSVGGADHPAGPDRRQPRGVEAALRGRPYVLVPETAESPSPRKRRFTVARATGPDRRSRASVRWPLTVALGLLGAAIVALGALTLLPRLGIESPSGPIAPVPSRERGAADVAETPLREQQEAPPGLSAAPGRDASGPSTPAAESGAREAPPLLPPPRAAAPSASSGAAQVESPTGSAPAFPGLPRVDMASRRQGRAGKGSIVYTARVRDPGGQPLKGADVSLHAVLSDGTRREIRLRPTSGPGVYRGTVFVGARLPAELRVRVVLGGSRFEVPVEP
ncbi:MAG: hypothetical protein HYY95_10665 [Candidatus Rokubacteria bacterium]|nr:hypothetical protein [Candidatus Rokubacteria bacterium]MBI3106016.1 hypothetical protein [Candidatus Rokubacteria bacterium]